VQDPRFFRPADVDALMCDASKARDKLGLAPMVELKTLVDEEPDADRVGHWDHRAGRRLSGRPTARRRPGSVRSGALRDVHAEALRARQPRSACTTATCLTPQAECAHRHCTAEEIYNLGGLGSVALCWREPVLMAAVNGLARRLWRQRGSCRSAASRCT
jgi:hypothetical protein